MEEKIICSAIWYIDLPSQNFPPINIVKGLVICGLRHAFIIDILYTLTGIRTVKFGENAAGESIQGFLTNKNRFVDRMEAMDIALRSKQLSEDDLSNKLIGLFSEDIF